MQQRRSAHASRQGGNKLTDVEQYFDVYHRKTSQNPQCVSAWYSILPEAADMSNSRERVVLTICAILSERVHML